MKKRLTGFIVACILIVCALLMTYSGKGTGLEKITYNQMMEMVASGQVESAILREGREVELKLADGKSVIAPCPQSEDFVIALMEHNVLVSEKAAMVPQSFATVLLLIPFVVLLLRRKGVPGLMRESNGKAQAASSNVSFSDVALEGEALTCMRELVTYMEQPKRFERYGARLPRGVMLYGPPGTGKTLLARALAGEAKAPFFAMNGSDFVQLYVGVGASRVRELFKKARKAGKGVIFIDEIDAIGKKRDNGNDEREQTLNALLTEMSGFSGADGVVVVAATNRLDTLDEALLRAGRFDKQIEMALPERVEREKILKVHARNKPLSPDISLEKLARATAMFSGAQLESLLNEAARRAARRDEGRIEQKDVDDAYLSVLVGDEKQAQRLEEEKRITAVHEAGHALLTYLLLPTHELSRISIIPSTRGAAGYSLSIPEERLFHTRKELIAMMAVALGGRVAEEMVFGSEEVTTGAAGDLKRARSIASRMAREWEMGSGLGEDKDAEKVFSEAKEKAEVTLHTFRTKLHALSQKLIAMEVMNASDIEACLKE